MKPEGTHAIAACGVINPLCDTSAEFKYKEYVCLLIGRGLSEDGKLKGIE